jgi:hypothetical protein
MLQQFVGCFCPKRSARRTAAEPWDKWGKMLESRACWSCYYGHFPIGKSAEDAANSISHQVSNTDCPAGHKGLMDFVRKSIENGKYDGQSEHESIGKP